MRAGRGAGDKAAASGPGPGRVMGRVTAQRDTIVVLDTGGDVISLDLCLSPWVDGPGVIVKSMARDAHEAGGKTVDRIRLLYAPREGQRRGMSSKDSQLAACPAITVLTDTPEAKLVPLDLTLSNRELWKRATVLRVGEGDPRVVRVRHNVPTIVTLTPPRRCYVGLPLVCSAITTVFTQNDGVRYEWCVAAQPGDGRGEDVSNYKVLSTESGYVPDATLLGRRLLLRVTPDLGDAAGPAEALWTQIALPPVEQPPAPVPRWAETRDAVAYPAFRVVTYNILHDDFCTSKSAKECIYPFATDEVLALENRQVRILQELLAYHADILCLQECGKKVFVHYLQPALRACGYDGHYTNKNGNVQEGCAVFVRRERFTRVSTDVVPLNLRSIEELQPELAAALAPHAELREALTHLTTIGTMHTLRERATGVELVVGNTHLFYHANACHIRVLQLYLFVQELYKLARRGRDAAEPGDAVRLRPIVLCGDFNFTHATGAYRLVTTGQLEPEHPSWEKGRLFYWGCDRMLGCAPEETDSVTADGTQSNTTTTPPRPPLSDFFHGRLRTPLRFVDAHDRTDPSLPWTNYTMTFREVIDYVFFTEQNVDVLRTVPIPPESELAENFALPNAKYPSDHVALVADLTLKTNPYTTCDADVGP